MRIMDLVFIVAFLGVVVATLRAAAHALGGSRPEARRVAVRTGVFVVLYIGVVMGESLLTPRRWIGVGEEQRFHDWALTVARLDRSGQRWHAVLRVTSHARGRSQRAADAAVVLVARDSRTFSARAAPAERSLQSVVQLGESFEPGRDFDVPADAEIIGHDVRHDALPALFIMGDRSGLFHKRPLVQVP